MTDALKSQIIFFKKRVENYDHPLNEKIKDQTLELLQGFEENLEKARIVTYERLQAAMYRSIEVHFDKVVKAFEQAVETAQKSDAGQDFDSNFDLTF